MAQQNHRIKLHTIDSSTWVAVTPPMACNAITICNTGAVAIKLRTLDGDATTEKTIPAAAEQEIAIGVASKYENTRFTSGKPAGYLQTSGGTFDVPIEFVL